MKKSVFSETAKVSVLYSLAFLYGVTSTAVFWRLAWEFGVRRMKEITLSRGITSASEAVSMVPTVYVIGILFFTLLCIVFSAVFLWMMKRISTSIWLWLFGEGEEKSDNRRYLPLAVGLCVSLLAAVGFQDISCVIGYYAAVDLCMLPLAMVAAWLLVRLDFIQ